MTGKGELKSACLEHSQNGHLVNESTNFVRKALAETIWKSEWPLVSVSIRCIIDIIFQFRQNETLTLKAPITTAADDKFCATFPNFLQK